MTQGNRIGLTAFIKTRRNHKGVFQTQINRMWCKLYGLWLVYTASVHTLLLSAILYIPRYFAVRHKKG